MKKLISSLMTLGFFSLTGLAVASSSATGGTAQDCRDVTFLQEKIAQLNSRKERLDTRANSTEASDSREQFHYEKEKAFLAQKIAKFDERIQKLQIRAQGATGKKLKQLTDQIEGLKTERLVYATRDEALERIAAPDTTLLAKKKELETVIASFKPTFSEGESGPEYSVEDQISLRRYQYSLQVTTRQLNALEGLTAIEDEIVAKNAQLKVAQEKCQAYKDLVSTPGTPASPSPQGQGQSNQNSNANSAH